MSRLAVIMISFVSGGPSSSMAEFSNARQLVGLLSEGIILPNGHAVRRHGKRPSSSRRFAVGATAVQTARNAQVWSIRLRGACRNSFAREERQLPGANALRGPANHIRDQIPRRWSPSCNGPINEAKSALSK